MKNLIPVLGLLAMLTFSPQLTAQEEEQVTYYHTLEYMKVPAGGHEDYVQLEGIWKKIHQANIEAGKYTGWELAEVIFPTVGSSEYNYVTRTVYAGAKQLGEAMENWAYPENLEKILTAEELKMVQNTDQYRTMVRREVWLVEDVITNGQPAGHSVVVFNYFDSPEGKNRGDHFRIENDIWKPVHQLRIDAGEMVAWGVANMIMPWGSDYPYDSASADYYNSVEQFLQGGDMESHFAKAHSGKKIDDLMATTNANTDLIRSEVRKILDSTWIE